MIAFALAATCITTTTSPALATSLKGEPFVIDPTFGGLRYYSSIFPYRDGFAAGLAQADEGGLTNKLYFKAFRGSGDVRVAKTLAAEAVKDQDGNGQILGAGGLGLDGGRALIGYLDLFRSPKNRRTVGGLFARPVGKNGKPSGELTLDDAKSDIVPSGHVIPLARRRGLAVWTVQHPDGSETSSGRFIGADGKLGPVDIDLTRAGSAPWSVSPFGAGFVTLHRKVRNLTNVTLFGQVHDGEGKKVGRVGVLAKREDSGLLRSFALAGLDGGRIVALNTVYTGSATNLVGQVYDGDWNKVGRERVLMKGLSEAEYDFAALPGGDFLVASVFDKGGSQQIELRRFDQKLKSVGGGASTKRHYRIVISQLLALKGGGAVISYDYSNASADYIYTHVGQMIEP